MTDIDQLLDELQDLVDDKRERVAKLFADIRASVPRPMTLVFTEADVGGIRTCHTKAGVYEYYLSVNVTRGESFVGDWNDVEFFRSGTEQGIVELLQSHFDAAWSAMTAKGAAT